MQIVLNYKKRLLCSGVTGVGSAEVSQHQYHVYCHRLLPESSRNGWFFKILCFHLLGDYRMFVVVMAIFKVFDMNTTWPGVCRRHLEDVMLGMFLLSGSIRSISGVLLWWIPFQCLFSQVSLRSFCHRESEIMNNNKNILFLLWGLFRMFWVHIREIGIRVHIYLFLWHNPTLF